MDSSIIDKRERLCFEPVLAPFNDGDSLWCYDLEQPDGLLNWIRSDEFV